MMQVTCAVIDRQIRQSTAYLVCQRSEKMRLPLKWEFPGGKLEVGETPAACLQREIKEELGILIKVGRPLTAVHYTYPAGAIQLLPFYCRIISGEIKLTEHKRFCWQPKTLPTELDWAEADQPVIQQLLSL